MTDYLVGACGKRLTTVLCYSDFEDDLCASCPFNGWRDYAEDMAEETELAEELDWNY